jgi:hypothetical protein
MTTENFTTLSEGRMVPLEGLIVRCPRCGRNGVLERPQAASPFCLHKQETELCSDGMRSEPTDLCELADEGDTPRMD